MALSYDPADEWDRHVEECEADSVSPYGHGGGVVTSHTARRLKIVDDVLKERDAQDELFGVQDLPNGTGPEHEPEAVDYANAYRESCEQAFRDGLGTYRHVFLEEVFEAMAEDDPAKLRAELIQAIAVGVKWVEAIDRAAEADA